MTIKRLPARITRIADLSPTAREIALSLPEELGFTAGAFVNVFVEKNGKQMRRAYSLSSSEQNQKEVTLSIRKGDPEGMSVQFWDADITGAPITVLGPLGLNTADNIEHSRVFLCAFGIGISVVKSILMRLLDDSNIQEITILTASRDETEMLYKSYLEEVERRDERVTLRFVLSRPTNPNYPYKGYLQDHVDDFVFSNATVYVCGPAKACRTLRERIQATAADVQFLVEAFD